MLGSKNTIKQRVKLVIRRKRFYNKAKSENTITKS